MLETENPQMDIDRNTLTVLRQMADSLRVTGIVTAAFKNGIPQTSEGLIALASLCDTAARDALLEAPTRARDINVFAEACREAAV